MRVLAPTTTQPITAAIYLATATIWVTQILSTMRMAWSGITGVEKSNAGIPALAMFPTGAQALSGNAL